MSLYCENLFNRKCNHFLNVYKRDLSKVGGVAELVDAALSKRVFLWVQVPSPPYVLRLMTFFGSWCNGNITRLHRVAASSILALPSFKLIFSFCWGSSLMVECWVVVPRGAGSTPVSPDLFSRSSMVERRSVKP